MYSRKWMCKEGWRPAVHQEKPLVLRYQFLVVRHTLLGFQSGSDISAMKPEKNSTISSISTMSSRPLILRWALNNAHADLMRI